MAVILFGFVYAGFQLYRDASRELNLQAPITQQAGPCGANIVGGDKNSVTIDC